MGEMAMRMRASFRVCLELLGLPTDADLHEKMTCAEAAESINR